MAPQWVEGGRLSSPPMSNSSSFRFENVQHISKDNQEISRNKQEMSSDGI